MEKGIARLAGSKGLNYSPQQQGRLPKREVLFPYCTFQLLAPVSQTGIVHVPGQDGPCWKGPSLFMSTIASFRRFTPSLYVKLNGSPAYRNETALDFVIA